MPAFLTSLLRRLCVCACVRARVLPVRSEAEALAMAEAMLAKERAAQSARAQELEQLQASTQVRTRAG
eukprot:COSAG01_NODE_5361_length_4310_cov_8.729280_4_plen_68_part_00